LTSTWSSKRWKSGSPRWRQQAACGAGIEAVLDWAKAKRFRSGDNPALWRGGLKHLASAAQAAEREREWQN